MHSRFPETWLPCRPTPRRPAPRRRTAGRTWQAIACLLAVLPTSLTGLAQPQQSSLATPAAPPADSQRVLPLPQGGTTDLQQQLQLLQQLRTLLEISGLQDPAKTPANTIAPPETDAPTPPTSSTSDQPPQLPPGLQNADWQQLQQLLQQLSQQLPGGQLPSGLLPGGLNRTTPPSNAAPTDTPPQSDTPSKNQPEPDALHEALQNPALQQHMRQLLEQFARNRRLPPPGNDPNANRIPLPPDPRAEQARSDQSQPDQSGSEQSRSDQSRPGQTRADQPPTAPARPAPTSPRGGNPQRGIQNADADNSVTNPGRAAEDAGNAPADSAANDPQPSPSDTDLRPDNSPNNSPDRNRLDTDRPNSDRRTGDRRADVRRPDLQTPRSSAAAPERQRSTDAGRPLPRSLPGDSTPSPRGTETLPESTATPANEPVPGSTGLDFDVRQELERSGFQRTLRKIIEQSRAESSAPPQSRSAAPASGSASPNSAAPDPDLAASAIRMLDGLREDLEELSQELQSPRTSSPAGPHSVTPPGNSRENSPDNSRENSRKKALQPQQRSEPAWTPFADPPADPRSGRRAESQDQQQDSSRFDPGSDARQPSGRQPEPSDSAAAAPSPDPESSESARSGNRPATPAASAAGSGSGSNTRDDGESPAGSTRQRLRELHKAAADLLSGIADAPEPPQPASPAAAPDSAAETTAVAGPENFVGAALRGLTVVGLILAAVWLFRRLRMLPFGRSLLAATGLLADPTATEVRTRADVVRAFHRLALHSSNPAPPWWTHRAVASRLTESAPELQPPLEQLARVYEQARYLPPDAELSPEQIRVAQSALEQCAACAS